MVTSSGFVDEPLQRARSRRAPAGGSSLRSRRVRSAKTRCWFSCSASVRVAYVSHSVGGSGIQRVLEQLAGAPRPAPRSGAAPCGAHQEERLARPAGPDEVDGQVGDDVGDVAARVGLLAGRGVEHRIDVGALAGQDLPAVEARRVAAEVPLADHAGVVAAGLEQPRDGLPRAVEAVEHRHAVDVRVLAGQDRRAARRADRVGHEDVVEPHALAGEAVDVRRRVHPRAVGADRVGGVVVRHDEDDVRTVGGGSRTGQDREQDRQNRQAHRRILDREATMYNHRGRRSPHDATRPDPLPGGQVPPPAEAVAGDRPEPRPAGSAGIPARIGAHGRRVRRRGRVRPQPARASSARTRAGA